MVEERVVQSDEKVGLYPTVGNVFWTVLCEK